MPEGLGRALGAGAEAFQGALLPTLNYRMAIAQNQLQAGMQKERLAMDKESQAINIRALQQDMQTQAIEQRTAEEELKDKIRKGELARESDKLINLAKASKDLEKATPQLKKFPKSKEGKPFAVSQPSEFGIPEIDEEKLLEAYNLAGKKAPLSLLTSISEANLTEHELEMRRLDIESEESLIEQRRAAAEASRRPKVGAETQKDRDRRKLLDPNTPEDERNLIARDLLGGKTTIGGIPINDISRVYNDLFPEFAGVRTGLPEGIEENSIEAMRHVARIIKQEQSREIPSVIPQTDDQLDTGTGGNKYFLTVPSE